MFGTNLIPPRLWLSMFWVWTQVGWNGVGLFFRRARKIKQGFVPFGIVLKTVCWAKFNFFYIFLDFANIKK
jgi:hypothetical protein